MSDSSAFDVWYEQQEELHYKEKLTKDDLRKTYEAGFDDGWNSKEQDEEIDYETEFVHIRDDWNKSAAENGHEEMPYYTNIKHKQFVVDMWEHEDWGERLRHYNGRFHYSGPAIECSVDELQEAMSITKVKLQRDNMGHDLVVYPEN